MNKRYRTAGIWNVALGVGQIVFIVGFFLLLLVLLLVLDGDGMGGALAFLLSLMFGFAVLAGGVLISPVVMILVGREMIKGHTKGGAIKALFGANLLFKLAMLLGVPFVMFTQGEQPFLNILITLAITLLFSAPVAISVVMDLKAFFQRKEK